MTGWHVIHGRLVGLGFTGVERITRRAVAEVKAAWRTWLSCAWLAWSRFRLVIPAEALAE